MNFVQGFKNSNLCGPGCSQLELLLFEFDMLKIGQGFSKWESTPHWMMWVSLPSFVNNILSGGLKIPY